MGVNASGCLARRLSPAEREPETLAPLAAPASRAPSADAVVPATPSQTWRAGLGRAASGAPVLTESLLVATSLDRYVTALRRRDGDRVWRAKLSSPSASPPLVAGNRVFAASGGPRGQVYAFTISGAKLWSRGLGPVMGALAVAESLVVAGTERGVIVALATTSGAAAWTRRLPQPARAGVVAVGSALLVATDDSLYRLHAGDGSIERRTALPGTALSAAAIVGDTAVFATADGVVIALDAASLAVHWTVNVNAPVFGGAAVARDTVYAATIRGDLWRIPLGRPGAARAIPLRAAVRAPPSPTRSGILIGTLTGEILLVRGDSVLPQGRIEGPIEQPMLVADGVVYLIDGRGRVQAWR